MGSWVIIFTIVILGVQIGSNSLSNSDEVINVNEVWDVCVKVILEMFHHVQVGLNIFVSSYSWERETLVHKFPRMNSWKWSLEVLGNWKSVLIVLFIEGSWEHIHLPVKFFFAHPELWFAWSISWSKGINNWIITWVLELDCLSRENSEEHKISKFH